MDKDKILKEMEEKFKRVKVEFKMKAELEEVDKIYFITDSILKDGFVSEQFTRQICYRIVDVMMRWNEYLHSLVMPNPQNMLNMSESKILTQEERTQIIDIMKKIMELSSKSSILLLKGDRKGEAQFIDDAVMVWEKEFKNGLIKIMEKIHKEWGNKK